MIRMPVERTSIAPDSNTNRMLRPTMKVQSVNIKKVAVTMLDREATGNQQGQLIEFDQVNVCIPFSESDINIFFFFS